MTRLTVILAALVAVLLLLLGVVLKDSYEKSAKIAQLQDTIKSVEKAQKVIYKIREVAKDEDCYNTKISEAVIKELRK